MKITITCGRKFHSDHLGAALLRRKALERVITANPPFVYRRHAFPEDKLFHTFPYYLPGLLAGRLGGLGGAAAWLDWKASRFFDQAASGCLGHPDAVVCWAWSALKTLRIARKRGILAILEECGSANAHQEKILREEHERLGFSPRVGVSEEVIDNEQAECEAADFILCPSDYVAESFQVYGVPAERCVVIPYASNPRFKVNQPKIASKKLKILYVGSISPRKGLIYLLRALKELPRNSFECTVIGRIEPVYETLFTEYRSQIRHIDSVPHEKMPDFFKDESVFVLPTLDEGMAYVIMEALASGTPVITTANSGAAGKVIDGVNGYIVPIRNHGAILDRLQRLMSDPDLYASMSREALKASSSWTWDDYANGLLEVLTRKMEQR